MFLIDYNSTKDDLSDVLDSLPLASSNYLIPLIGLLYLFLVYYLGPKFMKNRNPYIGLKSFIIPIYNLLQIIANFFIVYWAIDNVDFTKAVLQNLCGTEDSPYQYRKNYVVLGYIWCIIKITDLLDTLFFVALKKKSHVSFLHVYHHYTTMMVAFIVFKYLRVEQGAIFAFINSIVHVIMYTYYFITAIGYKPKPYWKITVTVLQLLQFLVIFLLVVNLYKCQILTKYIIFNIYSVFQTLMYIYLFGRFFIKNYIRNKKED